MMKWCRRMTAVVLAAGALVGCVMTPVQEKLRASQDVVETRSAEALETLHTAGSQYLHEVPTIYVGGKPIPINDGPDLPAVFARGARLQRQVPVNLHTVAAFVAKTYGLGVTVTPDATASAATMGADPVLLALGADPVPGSFLVRYQGTLRGLLDQVASRTGNAWHYLEDRNTVVISHYATRTFHVPALPIQMDASNSVTNASQSGGAGGGGGGGGAAGGGMSGGQTVHAGQSVETGSSIKVLTDASGVVQTMLSEGGAMAVDTSSQSITVTDTPVVLARVDRYIQDLKDHLRRQVAIEVKIYSLDLKRGDQYGIDWKAIYQTLNGKFGITTNSVGNLGTESNSLSLSVIDPSYNYNGSQLLLKALAKRGKLVARRTVGMVTLSGRPAPVQIASRTGYLAKSGTTLVADAGATTSLTPGSVTTGFAMNILPVVLDDQHVLMQLSLNLSTLRQIRSITDGSGNRIETPDVDTKQFLQQVILPSDSTLVLSGYNANTYRGDSRGIGSPDFWLAGGSVDVNHDRTMLVILVTPKVM